MTHQEKMTLRYGTTYGEYFAYVKDNTNLPMRDTRLIVNECWSHELSPEDALKEALALYIHK